MDLKTYAIEQGGTARRWCRILADVAGKAACSAETVYMIAGGHKKPSARLAIKIDEATHGAVSRRELRPDIFGEPSRKRAA